MDDEPVMSLSGSSAHDLADSLADNKNPLQVDHEGLLESPPWSSNSSDSGGIELLPGGDQSLIYCDTLSENSPRRLFPVCSTIPTEAFLFGNQTSSNLDFSFSPDDCETIRKWVNKSLGDACGLSRLILELESFGKASDVTTDSLITDYWKDKSTCHTCPQTRQIWDTGFLVSAEFDNVVGQTLDSYVVSLDMFSDSSLAQVRKWITECDNAHPDCSPKSSVLPTRVLDVRDIESIRLCESSGEKGTYLALSHCWGHLNTFITTSSTIDSMRSGFHIKELPQTFRDAVIVTRALGHRYLWIDTLCIIQKDPLDWAIQSSKMGDVYAGSYLTLAASMASGDCHGFLGRDWRYVSLNLTSTASGCFARVYLETTVTPSPLPPLSTRAWNLQEQILSPRVLHFQREGLAWECLEQSKTEVNPRMKILDQKVASLGPVENGMSRSCQPWFQFVFNFSRRKLSYDTDKLPALSGIASRVGTQFNLKYCAGIWWEDFTRGLLWCVSSPKAPSEYLAPSWSWSSVNGDIFRQEQSWRHPCASVSRSG